MKTSTQVARWGNSLGLRLPKGVASEVRIAEGDLVEISVQEGTIVVKPKRPRYSLEQLVGKITPKNRHEESNWGKPSGRERW